MSITAMEAATGTVVAAVRYTAGEAFVCTAEQIGQRLASLGALLQQRLIVKFRYAKMDYTKHS